MGEYRGLLVSGGTSSGRRFNLGGANVISETEHACVSLEPLQLSLSHSQSGIGGGYVCPLPAAVLVSVWRGGVTAFVLAHSI